MNDYSKITLGELLSSENETIKRHALGILKQAIKSYPEKYGHKCGCGRFLEWGIIDKRYPAGWYCVECDKIETL